MHTSWRTTVHTLHTSWCTTTVYTIWRVTQTDLRTTSCHSLPPSYIGSGLIHRTHLHYSTGCALLLCVFCEIKLILNIIWYWYWHCTSIWMKNWPHMYIWCIHVVLLHAMAIVALLQSRCEWLCNRPPQLPPLRECPSIRHNPLIPSSRLSSTFCNPLKTCLLK